MKRLSRIAAIHLVLALSLMHGPNLRAADFKASGDKRNLVSFESRAPLETIVGVTSSVSAELSVDLAKVLSTTGKFVVVLKDLDSGLKMRDEHMMGERFLDEENHPTAIFEILEVKKASAKKLKDKKSVEVELLGNFTVKGITKKIGVKATITYFKESAATRSRLPGDLLHVLAKFSISLPDFKITVPKMMVYKLSDSVNVTVDVFMSTGGA